MQSALSKVRVSSILILRPACRPEVSLVFIPPFRRGRKAYTRYPTAKTVANLARPVSSCSCYPESYFDAVPRRAATAV
jgi:hypothetical protein